MLSGQLRILNFDDSLTKQKNLINRFNPEIVNFKDISSDARLWMSLNTSKDVLKKLHIQSRNHVTFTGSGDYHHVSSLLISKFEQPITLIIFDHHPDWDICPPKLGCGSWVTHVLNNYNVGEILIFGVSSDDLSFPSIQTANLKALKHSRLKIFPFEMENTPVLFRNIPDNESIRIQNRFLHKEIYWKQMKNFDFKMFIFNEIKKLKRKQVYISIDKDCLTQESALTNWEAGKILLEDLLNMLKVIKGNTEILGVDITGEYSLSAKTNLLKSICSKFDHPRVFSAKNYSDAEISLLNEKTNIKILDCLFA